MSLDDFLVHRCTVQRAVETRNTNGEVLKTWSDYLQLVPCRLVVQDERIASPQGLLMATTYRLLVQPNLALTAADRIGEVVMEDLQTQGPFEVVSVVPRMGRGSQHHTTLRLEKVV